MAFDLSKELYSPFTDQQAAKKLTIGGLLSVVPIVFLIPMGFLHQVLSAAMEDKDPPEMPSWENASDHFFQGFGVFVVVAGYCLAACLPGAVLALSYLHIYASLMAEEKGLGSSTFGIFRAGGAGLGALLVSLLILLCIPAALVGFAEEGDIPGGFRAREVWERVSASPGEYFQASSLLLPAIAGWAGRHFLTVPVLRELPAYFLLFYVSVVVARCVGKLYHGRWKGR